MPPNNDNDNSSTEKKLKYPKSIFFILSNEFCERFSYYGMRTVLALYLSSTLRYSEDDSTIIFHLFAMLCYFFPLFGAILADSFLGKFKTIFYLSVLYAFGSTVLSIASIPIPSIYREISLLGLLLIAIGTGGIKPCVSAFGGDQFILPQQSLLLQRFFSVFYFCINAGSVISTFLTPILRNNVKCFGSDSCFPLAFGLPAVLMIFSLIIFLYGRSLYLIKRPEENIILIFIKCITSALKNCLFNGGGGGANNAERKAATISEGNASTAVEDERRHWLEYADDSKYSRKHINDIRAVLNVLYLFLPIPVFWALFDQQGSRWTFQATNMDGRVLNLFHIKPDQMQVVNPLLILAFIPLFELYVYPLLKSLRIERPLQKMSLGGFLAAISFVISAYVEFYVQKSYVVLPSTGEGQLRLFNALNCVINLNPPIENVNSIAPFSVAQFLHIPTAAEGSFTIETSLSIAAHDTWCLGNSSSSSSSLEIKLRVIELQAVTYFVTATTTTQQQQDQSPQLYLQEMNGFDRLTKNKDGSAKIRFFYSSTLSVFRETKVALLNNANVGDSVNRNFTLTSNNVSDFYTISCGTYTLLEYTADNHNAVELRKFIVNAGEIDTILLERQINSEKSDGGIVNLVPQNDVHVLWQLPQIIVITAAEIMFSITGLEFSFTQAPQSMKSVLTAAWLLTVAFGNLIVVVIEEIKFFQSQVYEFLLFAALMVLDVLIFIVMSMKYTYVKMGEDEPCTTKNQEGADDNKSAHTRISLEKLSTTGTHGD